MSSTRIPPPGIDEDEDAVTEALATTEDLTTTTPWDIPEEDEEGADDLPELTGTEEEEEGSQRRSYGESSGRENDYDDDDDDDYGRPPAPPAGLGSEGRGSGESEQSRGSGEEGTGDEEGLDGLTFLKKPGSMDQFMSTWNEIDKTATEDISGHSSRSSIDINTLTNLTLTEAALVAECIVEQLEEDLAAYVERTGVVFPPPRTKEELKKLRYGLRDNDSTTSFDSNLSDVPPGEPSKLRLTYEKGVSVFADMSLLQLPEDEKVDKEVQVSLHRIKKRTPVPRATRFTQTLDMAFVPMEAALLIFKRFYPEMDDVKLPEPPSRQRSMMFAVEKARKTDPNIDTRRKGPQYVSLSNKKQLLQPLMDRYHKDEKYWTGSRFVGEYKDRQLFKGRYDHPTGVKMESEFVNGHFESQNHFGLISYPRGDTFEGEWRRGRYQTGQITFCDGLKFATTGWKYCEPPDRRFKVERYFGLKPAGMTLFSDQYPPPDIPLGMYDTGDGIYNPKNGEVRGYDGFLLRQANPQESAWIERNCRKVHDSIEHIAPNFLMERIPGSYVESLRKLPLTKKRYH